MSRWGRRKKQQEETSPVEGENLHDGADNSEPIPEGSLESEAATPTDDAPVVGESAEPADAATAAETQPGDILPEGAPEQEQAAAPEGDSGDAGDADENVDPESVKQMREIDQERLVAKQKGWHRLGRFFLEITTPYSDEVKLQLSKTQCEAMMQIEKIEMEKKAAMSDYKSRIEALQAAAIESAKKILHGENTDNIHCPAFFDPVTKERVYYDIVKGEEIKRMEARREDYQMKMSEAEQPPASTEPEKPNTDGDAAPSDTSSEAEKQAAPEGDPGEQPAPESQPEEGEVRKDEWRQDNDGSNDGGAVPGNAVAPEEEARAS